MWNWIEQNRIFLNNRTPAQAPNPVTPTDEEQKLNPANEEEKQNPIVEESQPYRSPFGFKILDEYIQQFVDIYEECLRKIYRQMNEKFFKRNTNGEFIESVKK